MNGISLTEAFEKFALLGAEWVMWLLVVMGLAAFGIFFIRMFFLQKYRVDVDGLLSQLTQQTVEQMIKGEPTEALSGLGVGRVDSMELEVADQVLSNWGLDESGLENVVQKTILSNRQSYERQVSYFGIVGSNAPFVGLFGTVIGVIISFKELGNNPKGGLEVVGPGISEALVATAVGLLVAIPAVIMFNTLKSQIRTRVQNSELVFRHLLTFKNSSKTSGSN
jgi:biopolymer transport protein ExbB/TolQ